MTFSETISKTILLAIRYDLLKYNHQYIADGQIPSNTSMILTSSVHNNRAGIVIRKNESDLNNKNQHIATFYTFAYCPCKMCDNNFRLLVYLGTVKMEETIKREIIKYFDIISSPSLLIVSNG